MSRYKGAGDLSSSFYTQIKRNAKSRDLEVSVSMDYLWILYLKQSGLCALSGHPLCMDRQYSAGNNRQTASLDRKDSSKGYVEGNVQWVHKQINQMKSDMTQMEFIAWAKKVAENFS